MERNSKKAVLKNAATKILCLVLTLGLFLTAAPATVWAAEADTELFDISGSSMTLGNTLQINFAIDTTKLTGTDNYIVISKEYADDRGTVTKTVQQSDWTYLNETTSYVSYSVSAKEMNDKLTVVAYDAAGQQLTNVYEDSVAEYCLRTLAKEEAKASPEAKKLALFVDMVNYGAAAQQEWDYNTDALANAGLTETQKGYATQVSEKSNILQNGEGYYGTSLSLKENILMNVAYNANEISDAAYAVVTFIDHYGNDESVTVQAEDFVAQGDTLKYISITAMAVADYRQAVTVTLYDAEGNAISTTVDSVESYLSRQSGALYDAIAAFGVGAYNYFHVNESAPDTGDNTTVITGTVSAQDGTVTEDASFSDGDVSAQIPAGVQVEDSTLTLTVTEKSSSDSGVALEEGQQILPLDIHIDGVSTQNATPIQVCLGKILPNGLNIGNVTLYHVEDGVANEMIRVMTLAELDAHNEFYYDPATGDITVAMATFSEVAMVSDAAKEWNGEADHSWYKADATELTIANADQLWSLSQIVGGMAEGIAQDPFNGKTIKLIADINLADDEDHNDPDKIFYPIGYNSSDGKYEKNGVAVSTGFYNFEGTFDGNGHTISNFYQNTWEMKGDDEYYAATAQRYRDGMGLFGKVYGGTVRNLTVKNFSSDGEYTTTGTIAAYADGATFENIAIFDCNPRVYNIGNGGIVGCVGWYAKEAGLQTTFTNITVDNSNKISALWGSWDVACGGLVGQYYPTSGQTSAGTPKNAGIHMENCHVAAQIDVYNDVCANYQYYAYRYAGMLIGSIRENETIDGHVYPKMDGITASGCTVHFGDWNDYYYCELVANSLASYTHDHQMSRLTQVDSVDVENLKIVTLDGEEEAIPASGRYNYVVVKAKDANGMWIHGDGHDYAECYHFVDGAVWNHADAGTETVNGETVLKEDKQLIYREFNQLFTGYGWGVTSKGVGEMDGVKILDREVADSVEKFQPADAVKASYTTGTTVTIGELFKAADDLSVDIDVDNVQVFLSPVGEDSTASGVYTPDTSDWTQGTLEFSGTGAATISITDYNYCKTTTITVTIAEPTAVDKFQAKEDLTFTAGEAVALGELFTADEGAEIDSATVTVTVSGVEYEYIENTADWTQSTIAVKQEEGTATVTITDNNYCVPATNTFSVVENDYFKTILPNTAKYLYRIGNDNAFALGKLFGAEEGLSIYSNVSVSVKDLNNNEVTVTYTPNAAWTNGTIQFNTEFTGPVAVTIDALGANEHTLYLEIVNGNNVTANSNDVITGWTTNGSNVLLENAKIASNGTLILANGTLFGNGFTIDATNAAYTASGQDYSSYVISMSNSNMDNVVIEGSVYPEIGGTSSADYNRALVFVSGDNDCRIANSFLSNTASPIRTGTNLELINTTLKGGAYANLDMRGGQLILDNVTTINQIGANEKDADGKDVVGLGIVVYQEGGSDTMSITIKNDLTQYNYLSEAQAENIKDTMSKTVATTMFKSAYTQYQYNDGTTLWVNTGIIGMNNNFNEDDIDDQRADGHSYQAIGGNVDAYGQTRYCTVYSAKPTSITSPSAYESAGQYWIAPTETPDYTTKNYVAKTEGSNDYCYAENGTVYISMDLGDIFNWDTDILSVTKNSTSIDITSVTMDGVDYKGKSIAFSADGNYQVVYKYSDSNNYKMDDNGNVTSFTKDYVKTITVNVVTVEPDAKNAVFSFGTNGTAYSARIAQIGDKTYVMPDVTATVDGNIGSTTVNGTTVYYPITEMYTSDGKTAHTGSWYACFPIFKDALQIIDYADKGTGDPVTYNQTNVTAVKDIPTTLKATNPTSAFLYSMNATNYPPPTTPSAVSGAVCYTCNQSGLTNSNTRNEMTIIAEYTYTDNAGTTYYYYIGYHCAEQTNGCVTADTLITLADGSQVRVDALTGDEELLVWNLETGSYDTAPIVFVDSDAETEYEVINLIFSDGSEVGVIYEHGFFDYDLGKYVYLDAGNAESYIGHTFVTQGDITGNTWNTATLTDVVIEKKVTTAYSPVTFSHLCYYTDGVLSMPGGIEGLFNIFDVDTATMAYDAEKKAQDIEAYGLYTYEDFADIIPEEAYYAFNGAYLKVAIGKGMLTWEDIEYLAQRYVPLM